MKKINLILLLALYSKISFAATPADEAIERLLDVTNAKALFSNAKTQVLKNNNAEVDQAFEKGNPSEKQKKILNNYRNETNTLIEDNLTWDKIKEPILYVYRSNLSKEDIEALTAFFLSPAGQVYVKKLPIIQKQINQSLEENLNPLLTMLSEKRMLLSGDLANVK